MIHINYILIVIIFVCILLNIYYLINYWRHTPENFDAERNIIFRDINVVNDDNVKEMKLQLSKNQNLSFRNDKGQIVSKSTNVVDLMTDGYLFTSTLNLPYTIDITLKDVMKITGISIYNILAVSVNGRLIENNTNNLYFKYEFDKEMIVNTIVMTITKIMDPKAQVGFDLYSSPPIESPKPNTPQAGEPAPTVVKQPNLLDDVASLNNLCSILEYQEEIDSEKIKTVKQLEYLTKLKEQENRKIKLERELQLIKDKISRQQDAEDMLTVAKYNNNIEIAGKLKDTTDTIFKNQLRANVDLYL